MATEEMSINLLKYVFPIVYQTVADINTSEHPCKFIIKGGASINYHLNMLRVNTDGLTYDIDLAPIIRHPNYSTQDYFEKCVQCNNNLYDEIHRRLVISFERDKHLYGISTYNIIKKTHNKLITMQIQINGSNPYDMIDFSYIDIHDEGSTFVKAITKIYGSLNNFIINFRDICSSPQVELCVVKYGLEMTKIYIESKDAWENQKKNLECMLYKYKYEHQVMVNNHLQYMIDVYQHPEVFGPYDPNDDNVKIFTEKIDTAKKRIDHINELISNLTHQLSDEYQIKLKNKFERFRMKYELLQKSFGVNTDMC